jgi:hypothetical protein
MGDQLEGNENTKYVFGETFLERLNGFILKIRLWVSEE